MNSFRLLTLEVANSFGLSYKDAEEYASWLKKSCLREYSRQLEKGKYNIMNKMDNNLKREGF